MKNRQTFEWLARFKLTKKIASRLYKFVLLNFFLILIIIALLLIMFVSYNISLKQQKDILNIIMVNPGKEGILGCLLH